MPPRATRIKDLLNTPTSTALTRVIVLCSPVAISILAYAGYSWVNTKIAEAPAVVTVIAESADTKRRVSDLETSTALSKQQATRDSKDLAEVKADVKAVLATVNKMAGAMEVRSGVKLTATVDTVVAATQN